MLAGIILNIFTIMHLPQFCHRGVVVNIHLDKVISNVRFALSVPLSVAMRMIFETHFLHFCSIYVHTHTHTHQGADPSPPRCRPPHLGVDPPPSCRPPTQV